MTLTVRWMDRSVRSHFDGLTLCDWLPAPVLCRLHLSIHIEKKKNSKQNLCVLHESIRRMETGRYARLRLRKSNEKHELKCGWLHWQSVSVAMVFVGNSSVCAYTKYITQEKKKKIAYSESERASWQKNENRNETSVCAGICVLRWPQSVCATEEEVNEEKFIKYDTLISGQLKRNSDGRRKKKSSEYTKNRAIETPFRIHLFFGVSVREVGCER